MLKNWERNDVRTGVGEE